MKVAVGVTDVAVLADDFTIEDGRIPAEYRSYELNEWDEYALEAAVQLKEANVADEVVTVTVGPERSEEAIRRGLAKGADRGVRVWSSALADTDPLDCGHKGELLGAAMAAEEPTLALTGVQTGDAMYGATGVMAARHLDMAWAAIVTDLAVDPDGGTVTVERELEGGDLERVELALPAMCTIQTGINEPRYASLRGIRQAQAADIPVRTPAELGVETTSRDPALTVRDVQQPTSETEARQLTGSATETAGELASLLRDMGVGE